MEDNNLVFHIIANAALGSGLSGSDRIFIECARRWAKIGHDVHVYVWEEGYEMCRRNGLKDVKYTVWPVKFSRVFGFGFLYLARTISGITGILKIPIPKAAQTVVYSASDFWPDSIPTWIIKMRNKRIKWVAGYFLSAPSPFKSHIYKGRGLLKGLVFYVSQWLIYLQIRKHADIVFVTNELDRWKFIDSKRLTPEKVIAVRGGVDTKTPLLFPEPKRKRFDAVFLGRFHPQKGPLELIDIWKHVCEKRPEAKLAMIGDGELESEAKRRIENYNLENNIVLFGFKDGIDKIKILKDSSMALYPAVLDHWSMAPVEAMSCGLPLISFDLMTLRVLHPKGVVTVPCYDLISFARAIVSLIDDGELRLTLQKEALEFAETWDWDKKVDELLRAMMFLNK